jgi:hypothetical protein
MKYYIYTLSQNNVIFYVGKTTNLKTRLSNHRTVYGYNVVLEEVDNVEDWKFWENYWIQQFKQWGFKLINQNEGGGGCKNHTNESKLKIGLSNIGLKKKPCSKERKERIKNANKGKKHNLGKKYNVKSYKKVIQCDLQNNFIKEWNNVYEILKAFKKEKTNMLIWNCCQGKIPTAYGYKWKYK